MVLARAGYKVTACDFCQPFLDIAKTIADREGLVIDFKQMDARKLEFNDYFFDYALLLDMIEHISEESRSSVLSEASRVLKKNGVAIISLPIKTNLTSRVIKSVRYNYKQPWVIFGAFWRFLIRQVRKQEKSEKTQITEEHPFRIPSVNELVDFLTVEFDIINRRSTKDTAFLVFRKKDKS